MPKSATNASYRCKFLHVFQDRRTTPKLRWNERADPQRDAISSQWERTRSAKRRPAMKKNSTRPQSPKRAAARSKGPITIGLDLGDKSSRYCVVGDHGEVVSEGSVATTRKAMG